MKALFTLQSAIDKSALFAAAAILVLLPLMCPATIFAAELQTDGQINNALIAKIKNPDQLNQTSLSYQTIVVSDPLATNLKNYLQARNSPLADYVPQLLTKDNWTKVLAISQVESNMCIHNLYYNCSGIGGQEYLRKYNDFGGWIDDMSKLLDTRYNGVSLDKMNCVYVQPCSKNWAYGSKKTLAELTALEQQSQEQRIQVAKSATAITTADASTPQLASLAN